MTQPVGRPFITVPMPALELKLQQALEVTLVLETSDLTGIEFTTRVLTHPGER